ncbi:MAG: molecular chaperone [Candidatus Omnitrophota bacterium]
METEKIYEFLANVFAKEPTGEFLRTLQEQGKEAFKAFKIDPSAGITHLSRKEQAELLAVEYAGLFLMPGASTLPRESLQRGEGRLWGSSTVEVNNLYKKFGFELDESFHDTPDHLSVELVFLAKLSGLEAEYSDKSLSEAKKGVLEVKKYFLKNHLLKWFPRFKDEVALRAEYSYYKEITRLLGMVLDDEWEELKNIKEEINV